MKKFTITLLFFVFIGYQSNIESTEINNNVDSILQNYNSKLEFYEKEAENFTSEHLYNTINSNMKTLRMKQNYDFLDNFHDESSIQNIAYIQVLEKRYKEKKPFGSFYYALSQLDIYMGLKNARLDTAGMFKDMYNGFIIASNSNIAIASFAIGKLYEDGITVLKSKFVASKWYTKAAIQYKNEKKIDQFLISLEKALSSMPNNQDALKLKQEYFK